MSERYQTVWIIYNQEGEKLKQKTIKHQDNHVYRELDPFEQELIKQGLFAVRKETLEQDYLKGKTFRQKLKALDLI